MILFLAGSLQAQRIFGKGDYTTKTYNVENFQKLELSGVFNVTLKQGNYNQVTVEAQENLQQYIIVDEKGSKLDIHFPKKMNLKRHKKINVTLVFTDFKSLEANMVGKLNSDGTLRFHSLEIDDSSVGNMDLTIQAQYLDADFSAVGNIYLAGQVKKADINSSIVGNLDASELAVGFLDIDNAGVGNVKVRADMELAIDHSGIGSFRYSGEPKITSLSSSGIGKVKQVSRSF